MHAADRERFLDPARLAAVFGEYRFTLSYGDLSTLRALVGGWMLCQCPDAAIRKSVMQEFVRLPAAVHVTQGCGEAEFGRALLTHLTQHDRVRLRSAVYRTESTRLTLEQVLKICERGAV